jgi:hypothetical protein
MLLEDRLVRSNEILPIYIVTAKIHTNCDYMCINWVILYMQARTSETINIKVGSMEL